MKGMARQPTSTKWSEESTMDLVHLADNRWVYQQFVYAVAPMPTHEMAGYMALWLTDWIMININKTKEN